MSDSMGVRPAPTEAIGLLAAGLQALLAVDWSALTGNELVALTPQLERQARRLPAAVARFDAALLASNVAGELGFRGAKQLLEALATVGPATAKRRLDTADRFTDRTMLTGQPLEPLFPHAGAELARGVISVEHATVIADTIERLPADVRAEQRERVERSLTEQARTTDPYRLRVLAARVVAHLDPDGPAPDEERRQQAGRELRLTTGPDGTGHLSGYLTPQCAALWQTLLTPLAAPQHSADLGRDTRTPGQRLHDAFDDVARRLLAAGDLPDTAGLPTTLIVTMTLTDLERRAGAATTHHGGCLSINQALRLASDASLLPVILDNCGGILGYGRAKRLASPGQRRALMARDRGCSFPQCPRPAAHSQIHHLTDWAEGGTTDLDNLTITCGYHNNEAPRQGWRARMINGIPHWQPPPWHPNPRPQRNYHHHPELIPRR